MRWWYVLAILVVPSIARADEIDCSQKGTKCFHIEGSVSVRAEVKVSGGTRGRAYLPVSAPRPAPPPPPPADPIRDHGFAGLTGSLVLVPRGEPWGGGAGGSFRIRGAPALALDLGASWVGYRDVEGRRRRETALALSAFMYPTAGVTVQPYGVASFVHDWSRAQGGVSQTGTGQVFQDDALWRHVGGALGLGVETFVTPFTSLFIDGRALLRFRYGGDRGPEFVDGGRSADTSVGVVFVLGVAVYAFGH